MSSRIIHLLTETGQIIRQTVTEQFITNPDAIITQLLAVSPEPAAASAGPDVRCLYNLGDGVSAFRQKIGQYMYYWNSIQLDHIPFMTQWELRQDPNVNSGKHFFCPWNGEASGEFTLGAPVNLPIPDDLIVHFHVEYRRNLTAPDIQLPQAHDLLTASEEFTREITRYYLTCFSLSRNTCVSLPLPNLYPDCHLCTGTAYEARGFFELQKHAGLVTSTRHFLKTWADTAWNRDLLEGPRSVRMAQYRRFVRFDAANAKPLPFSGCADWEISTSQVPLEAVYRPWNRDARAVQPVRNAEDEARAAAAAPATPHLEPAPAMAQMAENGAGG